MAFRPLNETKLVSLAQNVPGPVTVARLVELGAKATKVEPPSRDPLKHLAGSWYDSITRGQNVITLDLRMEQDRSRLREQLADADLLLTSFRPSALRRLRLDWESAHQDHPHLCAVYIIGYPPPEEEIPGHDLTYMAKLGLLQPPQLPITLYADLTCAERAVSVSLSLLLSLARTGCANFAWLSLYDSMLDFTTPWTTGLTATSGALGGGRPFYGLYQTSDGWIAVAALETAFSDRLRSELNLKVGNQAELESIFRTRTATEWEQWARQHDLPLAALR